MASADLCVDVTDKRQFSYDELVQAHLAGAVEGIVELYNKSQRLTQVNVFSYLKPGDNFPFKINETLNIYSRLTVTEAHERFPTQLFDDPPIIGRQAIIRTEKVEYGYCEVRSCDDQCPQVANVTQYLYLNNWVGVVRLSGCVKLYLMPSSTLTDHLGMTYPEHPRVLHGMFVRKLRRNKHSANISSGGDIDSAELEPRSKKRKIVSFAEDSTPSQDNSKEKVLLSAFTATPVLKLTKEKVKIQIKTPPDSHSVETPASITVETPKPMTHFVETPASVTTHSVETPKPMTHSVETPEPGEVIEVCEGLIGEEEAPELLLLETAERPIKSRVSLAEYKRRRSTTDDRGGVNRKEDDTVTETDKEKTPSLQVHVPLTSERYNLTTDDRGVVTESDNNTETKKELIERSPTTDDGGMVTNRRNGTETNKEQDPPIKVTPTADDGGMVTMRETFTETDKGKTAPIETSLAHSTCTYHLTTDDRGAVNKRANDKAPPIEAIEVTAPLTRHSTADDGERVDKRDDTENDNGPLNKVPLTSEVKQTIVIPDSRLITDTTVSISKTDSSASVSDSTVTVSDTTRASALSVSTPKTDSVFDSILTASDITNILLTASDISLLKTLSSLSEPGLKTPTYPTTTVSAASSTSLTISTQSSPILDTESPLMKPSTQSHSSQELITDVKFDDNKKPSSFDKSPVTTVSSNSVTPPLHTLTPATPAPPIVASLAEPPPPAAPIIPPQYFYHQNPWLMESRMIGTPHNFFRPPQMDVPRPPVAFPAAAPPSLGRYFPSDMFSTFNRYPVDDILRLPRRSKRRSRSRSSSRSRSRSRSRSTSRSRSNHSDTNTVEASKQFMSKVISNLMKTHSENNEEKMDAATQTVVKTTSRRLQAGQGFKLMSVRSQTSNHTHSQSVQCKIDPKVMNRRVQTDGLPMSDNYTQTYIRMKDNSCQTKRSGNSRETVVEYNKTLEETIGVCDDSDVAEICRDSLTELMLELGFNSDDGSDYDTASMSVSSIDSDIERQPSPMFSGASNISEGELFDDSLVNELYSPSHPLDDLVSPGNSVTMMTAGVVLPILDAETIQPPIDNDNDTAPSRVLIPFLEHLHQPPIPQSVIPGLGTEPSQPARPSTDNGTAPSPVVMEHLHQPPILQLIPGLDAGPSQPSTDNDGSSRVLIPFLEHLHQPPIAHSTIPSLDAEPSQSSTDNDGSSRVLIPFLEHLHQPPIPRSVIPGLDASQPAHPSTDNDNDTFPSRVPIPFLEHLHQPPIPHSPFPAPPPLPPSHSPSEFESEELPEKGSQSSCNSSSSSTSSSTSNNSTPRSSPEPPESGGMTQTGGGSHFRSSYGSKSPHNSKDKRSPRKQSPADHEPSKTECVDSVFIEAENKNDHKALQTTYAPLNRIEPKLKSETPRTVSPMPNFVWLCSPREKSVPTKLRGDSESPPKTSVNTSDKESSPLYDAAISIQLKSSAELNFENPPITTPKKPSLTAAQLLAKARAKRSSPEDRETKYPKKSFDTKPSSIFHRKERTNSEHRSAGSRSGIDMQQLMANFHQHMHKRSSRSRGSSFSRIHSYPPTHRPNPELGTSLSRSMPSIVQQVTPNQQQITPSRRIENSSGSSTQGQSLLSRDKQPKPCDQSYVFTPRNLASGFFGPALPMDMCDHSKNSDSSSPEELHGRNETSDFYGPALPMDSMYDRPKNYSSSPEVLRGSQDRAPFINTPVNSPIMPSPLHCPSLHSAVNSGCDRTLNIAFPAKTTIKNADSEDTVSINERAGTCFEGTDSEGTVSVHSMEHTGDSNDNPLSKLSVSPENNGKDIHRTEEQPSVKVQDMEIATLEESSAVEDVLIVSAHGESIPNPSTDAVEAGRNKAVSEILSPMEELRELQKQPLEVTEMLTEIIQRHQIPPAMEINKVQCESYNSIPTEKGESTSFAQTNQQEMNVESTPAITEVPLYEFETSMNSLPVEIEKEQITKQANPVPVLRHVVPSVALPEEESIREADMEKPVTIVCGTGTVQLTIESPFKNTAEQKLPIEGDIDSTILITKKPSMSAQHMGIIKCTLEERTAVEDCPRVSVQRDTYTSLAKTFIDNADSEDTMSIDDTCFEGTDSEGTVSVPSMDDLAHTGDSNDNPLSKQNISDGEEQPSIKALHMDIATLEERTAVEDFPRASVQRDTCTTSLAKTTTFVDITDSEDTISIDKRADTCFEGTYSKGTVSVQSMDDLAHTGDSNDNPLSKQNVFPEDDGEEQPSIKAQHMDIATLEEGFAVEDFPRASVQRDTCTTSLAKTTTFVNITDSEDTISIDKCADVCFEGTDSEGPVSVQSMDDLAHTGDSNDNPLSKQNVSPEDDGEEQPSIKAQHIEMATLEQSTAVEDVLIVSAHRESIPNPSTDSVEADRNKEVSEILSPLEEQLQEQSLEVPNSSSTILTEIVQKHQIQSAMATNKIQCDSLATEREECTSFAQTNQQEMNVESTPEIPLYEFETSMKSLPVEIEKEQIAKEANPVPVASVHWEPVLQHVAPSVALPEEESIREADMEKPITTVCSTGTVQLTIEPRFKNTAEQELAIKCDIDSAILINALHMEIVKCTLEERTAVEDCPRVSVQRDTYTSLAKTFIDDADSEDTISIDERADVCFEGTDSEGTVSVQSMDDLAHTGDSNDNLLSQQNISDGEEQPSIKAQHIDIATLEERTAVEDFPRVSVQRDTYITSLAETTTFVDNADSEDTISIDERADTCFEGTDSEGTVSVQSMDDLARTGDSNDNPLSKQNIYPEDDGEEQLSIKAQHMEMAMLEQSTAVEDVLIVSAHGESIPNPSTDSVEAGRNKKVSEILSLLEDQLQEQSLEIPKESSFTEVLTEIVQKHQIPSAMETNKVQCESYNSLATERGESTSLAQTNQQDINVESIYVPAIAEIPLHEFETSMKSLPVEIEKEQIAKEANSVPVASVHWEPVLPHVAPSVSLPEEESTREADMEKPITTVCSTGTVQLTIEPRFKNTAEQELPIEGDIDSEVLINAQHMEIVKCTLEERTAVEDCPRVSVQRDTYTSLAKTFIDNADSEDTISIGECADICFEGTDSEGTVSVQSMDDLAYSNDNPLSKQNIYPEDDGKDIQQTEEQPSIKTQHMEIATLEQSTAVEDILIVSAHGESIPNPSIDSVEAGRNRAVSEILSPIEEIAKESSCTEMLTEIVQKHPVMETNKIQCESYNSLATERGECTSLAQTNQQEMNVESTPEIPLYEFETSIKSLPVEIEKEQIAKEASPVPVTPIQWEPVLPHLAPIVALPEEESIREADMEKPITTVCSTGTVQLTIEPPFKNTAEQELPIEGDIDSAILITKQPSMNAQHMKYTLEESTILKDFPIVSIQRDTHTTSLGTMTNYVDNAGSEDTNSIDKQLAICFGEDNSEGTVSVQSIDDLARTGDSNDNPLSEQIISPEDDGKDISVNAQHMEIATLEESTAVEDRTILSAHGESIPNPSTDSVEAGGNKEMSKIHSSIEEFRELQEQSLEDPKESLSTEMLTKIVQQNQIPSVQYESYDTLATKSISFAQTIESTPSVTEKKLREFETLMKSLPVEIEKEQSAKEANSVPMASVHWEPVLPHMAPSVALPEEESTREADMEKPITTVCGTGTVLTIEPRFKNTAEQELPIEGDIDSAILITKQPSMNAQHMKYTLEESTILKDFPIVSIQRDTHTTSLGTMTNYVDNAGSEDTNSIDKQLAICFGEDNSEGTVSVQSIDDLARTGDSNDNPLSEQIISPEDDGKDISVNAQHMEIATLEESTAVEDRTILSAHGESIPNPSTDSVEAGGNKEMSKIHSSIEEFRELQEQSLEDPKESLSTEMLTKIVQQNQIPSVQYESYDTLATKSISFAQTIESTPSVTEKKLREFETLMKSLPVEIEKEQSAKEANSVPMASVHWEPVLPHMAPSVALPEEESTREADMEKPITTVCSTGTVQLTIEPPFKNTAEQELAIEGDIDSTFLIESNLVSPVQVQSISSPCEAPIKLSTTSSQVLSEQSKIETDSSVQMMCDAKTIKLSDTREQLVMEEAFASEPACIELECEQSSSKERILEAEIQHESTLLPTTSTDTAAADEKESKIEYLEGSTNEFSADPVVTEQLASSGETDHEVNKQLSEINTAVLNKNELIPASPIGSLTKEPEQPSEVYVNDYNISFSDKDFELCHHSNNDHITEVTVDLPNDTSWDTNILLTSEHVVSKKDRITRRSSGRQRKISTKYKDSWLFTKDKDNSITLPQQKRKTTTAHLGTKSPVSTSTVEDLLPLVTRSPLITQLKPETTHYQYDPTQCVDTDGMCTADTLTSMQGDYYSQPSPKSKRSKLTSLSDGIPIHNKPSHLTIDTPVQSKSSDVPKSKHSKPTSLSDGIPIHNKPPHLTIDTPVQSKSSDVPKSKRSKPTSLSDGIPIHNKPPHLTIDTPVQSKSSDVPKSKRSKPTSLSDGVPIHNKPSHLTIDTPVQSKSSDVPKSKRSKPTSLSDGIPIHNKPSHLTIDTPVQSKSSDVPKSKRSKPTSLSDGIPIHNKPPHLTIDTPVQSKSSDVPTPLLSTHHKQCSQTRPLLTHTAPTSPPSSRATIAQQKPKLNKTTVKQTVPFSAKMSLSHFRHLRSISPKLPPSTEPTCEITHRQCDPRIKSQRSDSCTTEQSKRIDGPASIPVQVKCCSNEKLSKPTTQYTSQFKSNNMPQPVPTSPLSVHNSYLTGTIVKNAESNQLCLIITRKKPSVQPAAVKKKVISNSSELQTINVPDSNSTISTKQSVSVDSLPMQQGNSKVECEIEKSSSEIVATVSANENDGNVEYVSIVNHDSTDKMSITSQMSVTESNFEKTESSTVINHKVQVDTSTKVKSSTQEISNVEVHVPMNTAYADFKDTPSAVMHEQTSNAKIINERANTRSELFAPARPLLVSRPRYHPYYRHHPSSSYGSTYPA
ncbi:uncharacterized protein LOC135343904 isoform X2 [Halichondria panicea]|uniref:uncharacterized protein LOC135343904 isoform X2 n=1 Tax=Halichondria panicea TaxID=6063 RepID=UPI00312B5ADB